MCSICGEINFLEPKGNDILIKEMNDTMKHRGPDASDLFFDKSASLGHNRLCVVDIENGAQPMSVIYGNKKYTIVYNGEIYNCEELRKEIRRQGIFLKTNCDTEVVLYSYILYGEDCPCMLNGIFAFCVYDGEKAFFARDRFGVKPFYYSKKGNSLYFASEIKALLKCDEISRNITKEALWEILYLSPNFVGGRSAFKDILELAPAECMTYDKRGLKKRKYWQAEAKPYYRDRKYAIEKTEYLVSDAIKRQLVSDVPLSVLLSGGLDSSVVSAIASEEYKKQGEVLSTYSFEYEGNKESFQGNLFQPECDDDFATYLADYLGTNHTVLTCKTKELVDGLIPATIFRDLPGQADIDSSLLYFCREIKRNHTVALSGECSDEIFGGYPWFYRPEMLFSDFFPWIHQPRMRPSLFKDSVSNSDEGYEYIRSVYQKSLEECSVLPSDSEEMRVSRIASHLSVNYFMTSLLQRKDRMSMASGLEIRVPFADHRIYEFVYNVPWEIKFENKVEKALLRNSMKSHLPDKILWRKKSPYPKTHNKEYMTLVSELFKERYNKSHYLKETLDLKKVSEVIESGKTWFGQLMGAPQLLAWLVQFDFWLENNNINILD
ncbi:MAG: asparagine synthase (glutamine-hydrolyzing) [Clostridia bacterium]|nr:asparagine synthase (glutamine-hydrolyzing) [Clostridia bacterium]